jgi:hypothetical protein
MRGGADGLWRVEVNNSHQLRTPDEKIARLAARQHGYVTRVQLIAAGLDASDHHEHRFQEDRDRGATLLNAGFPVLRVTWRRLERDPTREAHKLRSTLDRRSTTAGPPA